LHFFYEIWNKLGRKDEMIPPHFLNMWDEYLARVDGFSLPENARFRQIHEGHAVYLMPEERRFVTPDAISAICMVGSAEDIIDQIRTVADAGIKEINLMPADDYARGAISDFAEHVIPAFR
jgi:alkanesulfonate monooxygenase SsuD/methylene tetrahydromethanopterin reductase-like flavin-dependent oxidoreductase (luciferase family)